MKVSLRQIEGPWASGHVLDKELLSSVYRGDDAAGQPQMAHTRTEVGEATYRLKHRSDASQAAALAQALRDHVCPRIGPIGFIVPMPPARERPWQPVNAVARALALQMRLPVFERLLIRAPMVRSLQDLATKEEKLHALAHAFSLHDEIRNQGLWDVLLIDDLYDSGATLEAASVALRKYRKINHLHVAALTWR